MMGGNIWAYLAGIITFLAVLAAFSRIVTMPESPKLVSDAGNALSNLFQGVFK